MTDAASNYTAAYAELRRRLVAADLHRFALPGEPEPGYSRRRARAQNDALCVAAAVLAVVVMVMGGE